MESVIKWSAASGDADNEANLAAIADWWASLSGLDIIWQQRELSSEATGIDWTIQNLDERFKIMSPVLKGITLFWRKPDQPANQDDRNITVSSLELDLNAQTLTAMPASGRQYLFRIISPKVVYRQMKLANPRVGTLRTPDGGAILLCQDDNQALEVQIVLDAESRARLLASL
jgi:hypothetical protein